MGLDGAFGPAQRASDVLIGVAANDQFKDLPLARICPGRGAQVDADQSLREVT
jgi:hypothetical protein